MKSYTPPIADIEKGLKALERLSMDVANPAIDALDPETQSAILQEAARFATEILSPLNALGDQQGAQLEKGQVSMPEGFKQVYHQFCQQGWSQAGVDEAYGGQPLPMVLMVALYEMFNGANAAFSLLPMLNFGAILTLAMVADDVLKERYVGEMVAGHLSAAMVLTEAEAGSDMSAIRTYAIAEEGSDCYRVFGQKQFITYGDHDLT